MSEVKFFKMACGNKSVSTQTLMWEGDGLLEDVNGKGVEELAGTVLALLVEARVFRLLGCGAMDVPVEAQTSPLLPSPPRPRVPQHLVSLSGCDAYRYARCPCAVRSLWLAGRQLVVRIPVAGGGRLTLLRIPCGPY